MCGTVTVGAVLPPPAVKGGGWGWRLWVSGETSTSESRAKSEQVAKDALLARFTDFLCVENMEVTK